MSFLMALTVLVLAFVALLLETRAMRADLAEMGRELAGLKASAPAAPGFGSVQDFLGAHAREVIGKPRGGEVVP